MWSLFVACVALIAPCVVLRKGSGCLDITRIEGGQGWGGRASVSRTGRWHPGLFSPQVDTPDFIQEMQEFRSLAYSRLAQAWRARFDPRAVDPRCPFRTVACLQEVFAGIRNVATCSGWLGKSHQKAAGGWRRMAKKHRGCSREERCNVKIQYYDLAWRYVRPSAFSRLIISCFPRPKQNIAPFTCQRPLHNTLLILFKFVAFCRPGLLHVMRQPCPQVQNIHQPLN